MNYIKTEGTGNTLLDALNKNKETSENSAQKNSYEKLDKEANQLMQAAESLLQDGEASLFEQAKANGNNQKVYDGIESFFEKYNSTLKALKNTSNTMNDFYRQMMLETSAEAKDAFVNIGINFSKDGTATLNMEKVKNTDIATLESLFGKESDFVNKTEFLSTRISDNAEANIESLSSAYNANGSLYTAMGNGKIDIWG